MDFTNFRSTRDHRFILLPPNVGEGWEGGEVLGRGRQAGLSRGIARIIAILGVLWLAVSSAVWGAPPPPALKVAATIFPLYDLVRQVAGPAVEVVLLVPPGASEHTFNVKPGTVRAIAGCRAMFAIGHGLDDWAARLAREAGVQRTIVPDAGVTLRRGASEHPHGDRHAKSHTRSRDTVDPHYWLSIPNASRMVHNIADALGQIDPPARAAYQQRAAAYLEQLDSVDAEIRRLLTDLPRRDIATFHRAFDYFAEAYGLQVVAVFEPVPGKEPGPRYVEAFQRQVRAHKLRTVFIEPQLSEAALRGLTQDLGITLRKIDPLGGAQGVESYLAMMQFNASQIAAALRE
jgi:ABC-type Zn uptake system ZnuABC Zn-binding protein ZnuA